MYGKLQVNVRFTDEGVDFSELLNDVAVSVAGGDTKNEAVWDGGSVEWELLQGEYVPAA